MYRAAGALRISTEYRNELVSLIQVDFDALGDVVRQYRAAFDAAFVVQRVADAQAGCALPREAERVNLRARHLQDPDTMRVAQLQQRDVHCR